MSSGDHEVPQLRVVAEVDYVARFPVRPSDIELASDRALGGFGKYEVEIAAGGLIKFFQVGDFWLPFTIEQLARFYDEAELDKRLMLFGLLCPWFDDGGFGSIRQAQPYLVHMPDGTFSVTSFFIERCSSTVTT